MNPHRSWIALATVAALSGTGALSTAGSGPQLPTRWILIYAGSPKHHAYSVDDFLHVITEGDTLGKPTRWLMTGALFLEIYSASGRAFATWAFHPPANGADWEAYLDSIFASGAALARLDSAVRIAITQIGPLGRPFPISVMIPYPDSTVDTVQFQGTSYRVATPTGRLNLIGAYVRAVRTRFGAGAFRHLVLYGLYWLNERVEAQDRGIIAATASVVHDAGLKFLWIPYYMANGYESWRALSFDEAWYQPNYFFHPEVARTRVDSAMRSAEQLGMGIELELDPRLFTNPDYANRLTPYIETLWLHPALRDGSVAVYDGAGALIQLSRSRDPRYQDLYHGLANALNGPPVQSGPRR